jgi:UDP-glucose 4-epimerase
MKKAKSILVTGGCGYIGSHLILELIKQRHRVIIIDNLSNSSKKPIEKIAKLFNGDITFVLGDVRDEELLYSVISEENVKTVFHLAGIKSITESLNDPIGYFDTNVHGTIRLLKAMEKASVFNLVFSSSATVYGEPITLPITETHLCNRAKSPYGISKQVAEQLLESLANSDQRWKIAVLRYFNPAGADDSGIIGEHPKGKATNLIPLITKVAAGEFETLEVFGSDYETADGTGVRDYIHVSDLAEGHIAAMNYITDKNGVYVWNLGTGKGHSVNEIIAAYEAVIERKISCKRSLRRPGDVAECYADTTKASVELKWRAHRDINTMVRDAWNYQTKNSSRLENNLVQESQL